MCGIAGFTLHETANDDKENQASGKTNSELIVKAMLNNIAHRGPDQSGLFINHKIALGHVRLSIMVPTGGQQPRTDVESGFALSFNGEIYNHMDLRSTLPGSTQYRDSCDTETLFHSLKQHGVDQTLQQINGMFAFAWYDQNKNKIMLARDRFGEKPLYYAVRENQLIFGSELSVFKQHPLTKDALPEWSSLITYLTMEYIPGPSTGFEDIYALPPGHILEFDQTTGQIKRIEQFWNFSYHPQHTSYNSYQQQLEQRLHAAVTKQLFADRPLGVFLSGGLDSSLIASIAKRHVEKLETFTVKFNFDSFDESQFASLVAKHIHSNHHEIEITKDNCISGLEELASRIDFPFCDSSMLPTFLLCKYSSQHVKVALGGDGADELFLGYPNFKLHHLTNILPYFPKSLSAIIELILKGVTVSNNYMNLSFLLRQFSYGIGCSRGQTNINWMAAIPPQRIKKLIQDVSDVTLKKVILKDLQAEERCSHNTLIDMQKYFINRYLPYDILTKTDRASMYTGMEVRSPFLDAELSNFLMENNPVGHPARGVGKRDLKAIASAYLPEEIRHRKKHGFGFPVSRMIKTTLKCYVHDNIFSLNNPLFDVLSTKETKQLWVDHMSNKTDNGKSIWAIFWLSLFLSHNT